MLTMRFLSVFFLVLVAGGAVAETLEPFQSSRSPTDTIVNYEIVHPVILNQDSDEYPNKLEVQISTANDSYTITLEINKDLLPAGFTSVYYDEEGREVITQPEEMQNCYCQGEVEEHPAWTASMSTCQGLKGSFGSVEKVRYGIEPLNHNNASLLQAHALYLTSEYTQPEGKCGSRHSHGHSHGDVTDRIEELVTEKLRQRRQTNTTLYIELLLVNDYDLFVYHDRDLFATIHAALEAANEANSIFRPLNVRIAVVDIITWTVSNRSPVDPDPIYTLELFRNYQEFELRNRLQRSFDSAMLLTGSYFYYGVVGVAYDIGGICDPLESVLFVQGVHSIDYVARVIAHELGHIMYMEHDTASCNCSDGPEECIMNAFTNTATEWSSCSREMWEEALGNNSGHCLTNMPSAVPVQEELKVNITVEYDPPPGSILGPNEYRAGSGPVTVTCSVIGPNTGNTTYAYQWSSTCKNCPFKAKTLASASFTRAGIHATDNGTHTCTIITSRDGKVIAKGSIDFLVVGAGVQVFTGSPLGNLPNNGLATFDDVFGIGQRLNIFCRSDSATEHAGDFIGPDGSAVTSNSFFTIARRRRAEITIRNTAGSESTLTMSQQGVYTCRMPLQSGTVEDINIGIYPYGFSTPPSIVYYSFTDDLLFASPSPTMSSTVTCITTGSPPTTVTWTRNGQPLVLDGSIYHMVQTVTNRAASTYENVLIVNQPLTEIIGSSFTCMVTNTLGSETSSSIQVTGPGSGPVNECDSNNGRCSHNCTDTAASFYCSCSAGYILARDGRSCYAKPQCNSSSQQLDFQVLALHAGSEVHKPVRLNTFHVGMVVVFEYISPKTGDRIDLNFLHRSAPADGDKYVDKILFHMAIHGTSGAVLNSAVPYGSWGPEISFEEFPNYTPGKKITLRVEALASGFLLSIPCEGFQYTFSYRPQDGSITAINEIYVKEIYNEGRMYTQNIVVGKGVIK